jgi:hypothetical protein
MNTSPPKFPSSQRTNYQFPVYRWIGWLAVAGFAAGLTLMFFIAGMFGIPAPLGWAGIVIIFTVSALLLDRPKLLLGTMLFYFMLMPGNRLLGLIGLPLPNFIDELFFMPLLAVIVMNWIQRRQLREATLFPLVFCLLAAMSWYVNGKPAPFTAVRVTLIMLKSYIIWYYCRLTCTFGSERQLSRWMWGYVIYVALQFLYNMLWQQGPWPKFHPDRSGGVFGPDGAAGAHLVGYLSVFALLILAGWWVSVGVRTRRGTRLKALLLVLVIGYDLIFMTDTKHALLLFPFAFLPFLLHPKFPVRLRVNLVMAGVVFMTATTAYFQIATGGYKLRPFLNSLRDSPKGDMLYAVTTDFSHLVPYPLLGAGPGRFNSNQAVNARSTLARRYIIPYLDEGRRMNYFGVGLSGNLVSSSITGQPQTDLFILMGEFGWLGAITYYVFLGWIIMKLWKKSAALPISSPIAGYFMSLCCCVIFLVFTSVLIASATVGVLVFPLWILIGRTWDMRLEPVPDRPGE